MKCPVCGFINLPEARFCGHCGARLVLDCGICGLANPLDYRFCHRCGAPLTPQLLREAVPIHDTLTNETPGPPPPGTAMVPAPVPLADLAPLPSAATDTTAAPTALQAILESRLEGERRIATIILADIKSSTDLLERLGTERWVAVMNHVFQILETEIYRFGGKVDQFRGDGLVAFFGATTAHEDDPERAVLAALAMQEALKPYAAELAATFAIELSMRVGVNTGEVIVASVGDRRRHSEDTAMGEAIAVAARMESAAEPGTVLISEATYRLAVDHFEWAPLGEIMVKGISHPIAVYRPLRPAVAQNEAYGLAQPLIGREEEFQTLKTSIESLYAGRGGIVTLTGERGMGKSLLLREIYRYFVRQHALLTEACDRDDCDAETAWRELVAIPAEERMLRGRARSYDQSKPYSLWVDLLRHWLDIPQNEAKEITRERLRQRAQTLWEERMSEYYPYLAALLALPVEAHYAEQINRLDAETRRQQLFLAIREWVEALARQGALVISFSDMHWVDTTSLDLLKYCLPVCDYAPVLWLLVFRPEHDTPIWKFRYYLESEYPHRLTALTMRPLDATQSHDLIVHLIGANVLPPEVEALLIDKADGNPYYIQELIHTLMAQSRLVKTAANGEVHWSAEQPVTTLDLPDSLQTLLLARIDRLPPAEHLVLQMAAVIGPVFWCNVLDALAGPDLLLHPCLTTLLRAQLIRERGRDADLGVEYIFKSPLIRDAAYDSLLSPQRTVYHLQVAEYFEQRFSEDARTQYYGTLAHHYHHAGTLDKELFYTLKQAESAKKVYANAEAGEHYTRALALLDMQESQCVDDAQCRTLREQRFDALYGRCEIFNLMGCFAAMREDAVALLPLARQLGDPARLIDALLTQPGAEEDHSRAEVEAASPAVAEALALARQIGDRTREIQALIACANQSLVRGDPVWQEHAELALSLARQIGDQRYEARLLIGLGRLYASIDQPERGMEYLEAAAALSLSKALDHIPMQISLLGSLGIEVERSGDYYRLLTEYQQEQLHLSREIGHRPLESKALLVCGITQGLYLGDYQGGLDLLEESRSIFEGDPNEVYARLYIAQIQSDLDMIAEAQANLDVVYQIGGVQHKPDIVSQYLTEIILDIALRDADHLQTALGVCDKLSAVANASPLISQQYVMAAAVKSAAAHLELAKLTRDWAERESQYLAALKASQTAYDLYKTFDYSTVVECPGEEVLFRHSQALAANGYEDEAIKYLRRAYDEMIRKYAMIPPDSPFRRTYLDNISLHQDIRIAYAARVGSILTESAQFQTVAKTG